KQENERRPGQQEQRVRAYFLGLHKLHTSLEGCPKQCCSPRQEGHKQNWAVIPEGLDVLEFGSEVAFEIVFDDEGTEKIGVAAGAEDVPGKRGQAERRDRGGMKEAEGVAPALGEKRPEKNGASGKNDGGGAFGENGEAKEETEQHEGEPGGLRNDRRILIAREAEHDSG